jgi:hypothetical protein
MGMEQTNKKEATFGEVEFVKGCPLCERSDPQLEKTFGQFAQWLYAVMNSDRKKQTATDPGGGIDIHP